MATDTQQTAGRSLSITLRETQLDIIEGELLDQEVEVLVNAANEELQLDQGVGADLLAAGGPSIQEECDRVGGVATGTAVMTGAGELEVKHVIHAVGPHFGESEADRKLSSAVRSSLALAERHGMVSIALPPISTGDRGYPMDRTARITLTEIQRYIQGGTKLERVVVVLPGDGVFDIFKRELRRGFR